MLPLLAGSATEVAEPGIKNETLSNTHRLRANKLPNRGLAASWLRVTKVAPNLF